MQCLSPFMSCDKRIFMYVSMYCPSKYTLQEVKYLFQRKSPLIPHFGNYFQTELTSCERICPILKISSIEITNTCVTFTKLKICCPAHLYSRSYALEMMWETEICCLRFLHLLHMACPIKNWKYFYPLKPTHLAFCLTLSRVLHLPTCLNIV